MLKFNFKYGKCPPFIYVEAKSLMEIFKQVHSKLIELEKRERS
jgi:hypothetical protein